MKLVLLGFCDLTQESSQRLMEVASFIENFSHPPAVAISC